MEKIELNQILEIMEFEYKKYINENGEKCIKLVDLQQANLGDIESDEFELDDENVILNIINRMDSYVYDYITSSVIYTLVEQGKQNEDDIDNLSLEEQVGLCKKLNLSYWSIADYIINPEYIYIGESKMDKLTLDKIFELTDINLLEVEIAYKGYNEYYQFEGKCENKCVQDIINNIEEVHEQSGLEISEIVREMLDMDFINFIVR